MAKAESSVQELVDKVERGEIRLPEMQRRYVWTAPRVRDLLDSLYRGYPSGNILLWEGNKEVALQDFGVGQAENPYEKTLLLLDGQQRLTSLSAVIRGEPVHVRRRRRPVEILFNLEHPDRLDMVTEVDEDADEDADVDVADSSADEIQARLDKLTFVVATKKLESLPHWVKVTEVFQTNSDAPFLRKAGATDLDDPRMEKYSQRLGRLRDIRKYGYRMDILPSSMGYEEVTEIFVRVNSLGAKLKSSDLALAQITAKWPGSLEMFMKEQDRFAKEGFDLDLGIHLKNLVASATSQSKFNVVAAMSAERLRRAWDDAVPRLEFAINFARSNAGVDSPALLASPFLLLALGAYGARKEYEIRAEEATQLRRWTLLANAKGRYSRGSSETILDQDLATIRDGGDVNALLTRLQNQVGTLKITPGELQGRNQRSALFKTMFLAFRANDARDWKTGLHISLSHTGSEHKLQFHHIFPKDLLKGIATKPQRDDIANLAFIGGKTNRRISNQAPLDYIPRAITDAGDHAFETQCIPTDPELLAMEVYPDFLQERRVRIAEALNAFLSGD